MRVKQLWHYVPLPAKLKLCWDRITATRITVFYFIFSVLHCILQVIFQVQAFTINAQAATFLYSLVTEGHATAKGFFVLGKQLRFCDQVPASLSVSSCQVVWNGGKGDVPTTASGDFNAAAVLPYTAGAAVTSPVSSSIPTAAAPTSSTASVASSSERPKATVTAQVTKTVTNVVVASSTPKAGDNVEDDSLHLERKRFPAQPKAQGNLTDARAINLNGQIGVSLNGFGFNNESVNLDNKCLVALNWPVQLLDNTKREDVAFVAFQFWVLGTSLVALLNESIPHSLASLLTHLSATAWGAFQIYNTNSFHNDFKRLTTEGACQINLLPNYWSSRANAEIPSLALNAAALLVSCFLSFRLIKLFGWQTFKRVGASMSINRIYKLVLTLSIVIQLSLFFVVAAVALWLDQTYNGAIGSMALRAKLYQAVLTVVLLLLPPWLVLGWIAVRKELKAPMLVFLVLSMLYLISFGVMFDSTTFRWTFVQWGFFSVITTLSAVLTMIAFVVGLFCRFNFDKGLTRYLNAQEPLPGDDFVPVTYGEKGDIEKVDFPSTDRPIPTFSAAFGSGAEVPPPTQMFAAGRMGPRFYNQSAQPFEQSTDSVANPEPAYSEASSASHNGVPSSVRPLVRQGSSTSQFSVSSMGSSLSAGGSAEVQTVGKSRWVIE
ncbi:hypothetical protein FA95DRAFT_1518454 [Auriscalpium vulgare]|uniref:Uncharacterized protein n=1 Tax=Auriscalpium vulgare TaxID=40419 RepID=A0ACB8RUS6_9AGAM|nr:hypothetical protein FA95DRAFT_1518454 [Auriscalpium vulgare]